MLNKVDLQKSKNTHQNDKTLHIFGNNRCKIISEGEYVEADVFSVHVIQ